MSARRLLPSIEAQTVAFVEAARASDRPGITDLLHWAGFRVYLRYHRNYTVDDRVIGEVLTIAKVMVPERLQRRGWFWRYCQLCLALVEDAMWSKTYSTRICMRPSSVAWSSNFCPRKYS